MDPLNDRVFIFIYLWLDKFTSLNSKWCSIWNKNEIQCLGIGRHDTGHETHRFQTISTHHLWILRINYDFEHGDLSISIEIFHFFQVLSVKQLIWMFYQGRDQIKRLTYSYEYRESILVVLFEIKYFVETQGDGGNYLNASRRTFHNTKRMF